MNMGKIIAIANQKGGVAKTTSTINLAYALLNRGKRVLAIDADPQASLTISFGEDEGVLEDSRLTLYFSLLKDRPITDLIIKRERKPDLVASSILLSKADAELLSQMSYSATLLREKLAGIVAEYDYILIDCPPTLTLLTANAIAAAHNVLIPVKTDYLSVRGIPLILETIEALRVKANKNLEVLGVLPTLYNTRYNRDNEVLEQLQTVLKRRGIRVFDPIPRSVGFDKATSEGVPALVLLPNTPGVENYYKLADEIINHAS
jgi:chromosome partitioning protein